MNYFKNKSLKLKLLFIIASVTVTMSAVYADDVIENTENVETNYPCKGDSFNSTCYLNKTKEKCEAQKTCTWLGPR